MADVQLENGYTRIAHDLLRALMRAKLSALELQMALAIIDRTYGAVGSPKTAKISVGNLARSVGIDRRNAFRVLGNLVSKGIVTRCNNGQSVTVFGVVKDYECWQVEKRAPAPPVAYEMTPPRGVPDDTTGGQSGVPDDTTRPASGVPDDTTSGVPDDTTVETETKNILSSSRFLSSKNGSAKPNSGAVRFDLPEWVPTDAWGGFEEMRRTVLKKPLTDRARSGALTQLSRLREQGHDPGAVLDQSTFHCWQGLHPIRQETRDANGRKLSIAERVRLNCRT